VITTPGAEGGSRWTKNNNANSHTSENQKMCDRSVGGNNRGRKHETVGNGSQKDGVGGANKGGGGLPLKRRRGVVLEREYRLLEEQLARLQSSG